MTLIEWIAAEGIGAQKRLAKASGISENTISQLARGRAVGRVEVARAVSKATGGKVSVATLMALRPEDLEPERETGT